MVKNKDVEKFNKEVVEEYQEKENEKIKDISPADLLNNLFTQKSEELPEKDKVIEILFEHKDLRKVADITKNQMIDVAVLTTIADALDVDAINYFCDSFLALSFSKERKSRQEIVEIYKTSIFQDGFMDYDELPRGRFSKLRDKFNL